MPLLLATLIAIVGSASLHATEKNTQVIGDAVYLKPQRLVEVEPGRRMNVYCWRGQCCDSRCRALGSYQAVAS